MLWVAHYHHSSTIKGMEREPTTFESRVYEALCRVPVGNVVTYKTLGSAVGCASGQAIGNAMRRNPYAPEVPCHRVIPATLKLGGFMGDINGEKVERKRKLLEDEGVRFDNEGTLLDDGCLMDCLPD
ncbi:MAG: methylated-DNA-[protein]-cysteine S-methyltransferase [Rubritalea sp.]|jgi:methylated-DNA-[protein]-cysteine S-methyltransferase